LMPSSYFQEILAVQNPFPIGKDASARTMIACNYEIAIQGGLKLEREIATLLHQEGLGVYSPVSTTSKTIFAGANEALPTGAGPYILITNRGGSSPSESHDGDKTRHMTIQVTIYATNPDDGDTRAEDIWSFLDGRRNFRLDT
jgi:hypothetical protein